MAINIKNGTGREVREGINKAFNNLDDAKLGKTEKAADSDKLDGLDSSAFIRQTDRTLISEYAHITHGQELPDGDYSSPDFWLSVKPGIYYAVREKGRNKRKS